MTGLDLRIARVRARLRAVEIAARMGVSKQRVSNIEALDVVPDQLAARYLAALEGAK